MKNSVISRGFTIVELLLVTLLMIAIGTISVIGYTQFNNTQQLQNTAYDVVLLLQKAKSRAQTQVKPSSVNSCNTNPLSAYEVRIDSVNRKYDLYIICGSSGTWIETKNLPSSITSISSTQPAYTFTILSGAVNPGSVQLNSSTGSKTIVIDANGNIRIQ